ncbi:hypothetical protein, conserved [Eimeria acervulina]|uniref:Uncharacterized protein n=1 Tax=Eimeria acervulina TaxID=5801 RepID=U6GHK4_EIMAC|nr:hypothetical protein, conserved [Eimeria acervulina]CDI78773.1 hypothetical protein, conserved [Eimeria acervulina]
MGLYICLSTLLLTVPLVLSLPLLRRCFLAVASLLDVAAAAAAGKQQGLLRVGFLLFAACDALLLRSCMQEALKFAVSFQLQHKLKIHPVRLLMFYSAAAAATFSCVMTSADAFRLTRQILSHEGAAAAAAAAADAQARRIGALGSFAAFHGVFELPLQIVTSLLIACRLAAADKETGISFLQVLRLPVVLHAVPAFCTQLARHVSQTVAMRLLWGRPAELIPPEAVRAVAATTALCHFVATMVMVICLIAGLVACRRLYLRVIAAEEFSTSQAKRPLRLLFSYDDLFQEEQTEDSSSLLEPEDQA